MQKLSPSFLSRSKFLKKSDRGKKIILTAIIITLASTTMLFVVMSLFFIYQNRLLIKYISHTSSSNFTFGNLFPTASMTPTLREEQESEKISDLFTDWKIYRNTELGLEFKYPPETNISKAESGSLYLDVSNLGYLEIKRSSLEGQILEKVLEGEATAGESGIKPKIDDFQKRSFGEKTFYYHHLTPFEAVYNLDYFLPSGDKVFIFRGIGYTNMNKYQFLYEIYGDHYEKVNQEEEKILETEEFHLMIKNLLASVKLL